MIQDFLKSISVLLTAVIFHEYAHGWVANRLGDPTAKLQGRLTLNPLKHIDPIGSVLVPAVLKIMGYAPFGWARPVPVNFANLRNPKRDMMLVAGAGPLVNIVMALLFSELLKLPIPYYLIDIIYLGIIINLVLAVFNMIPIPPLDGSRILVGLLPRRFGYYFTQLEPFGIIIVLVMLNFGFLNFIWIIVAYLAGLMGIAVRI